MPATGPRTLAVRLDSAGDVLLTGPAVRALAATSERLSLLVGPLGRSAAELLPHVDEVLEWTCPWIHPKPPPVSAADVSELVARLRGRFDRAVVFTSFHQSPLPTALLLRLAGVSEIAAISDDYPGTLLDLRHRVDEGIPEAERALDLAVAAGGRLPEGDDGHLRVRRPLPPVGRLVPRTPYVVLHPGTSVPARAWPAERFSQTAALLSSAGWRVVVTGAPSEADLTAAVAGRVATDLGGRTSLAELAAVLDRAAAVVVGNTGPAHLAAAVDTPVVSLFAPTVPAVKWAPYAVPTVLLGDQDAACAGSRATVCPAPGHPCLSSVTAGDVLDAVTRLTGGPASAHRREAS